LHRILLSIIIIAYILLAALYAINTPKWQAPDEPAHFNYIRAIVDTGALPVLQRGDYDQDYLEKIKAAKFPSSLSIDSIRYESYQPPLYYLAAAPIYFAARILSGQSKDGLDATVIALRFLSIILGAILLYVAYRIVHEIFSADEFLALATVGAIATIPQFIAISASISNDTAANLLLALILWLAVRRVQNNISDKRFVILGGIVFGAALLTKTTTYVPGAALLVAAESARWRVNNLRFTPSTSLRAWFYAIRHLLFALALSLALFSPWLIRGALTYGITDPLGIARHDAVVLGQPTTAEMIARYGFNHIAFDYFAVTFKSFWGQFGWMGVLINDRFYVGLMALTGAAAFGAMLWALKIVRHRELLTETQHWLIGLLILLLATAFADYIAYNFKFFQLQGRYLFPATISIALFLVIGLREILNSEYERIVFAMLYLGMLALDFICLFVYIVPQLKT